MHTLVTGATKKITNEKLIEGSQWLGDKLLGKQLSRHVDLEIILIPHMRRKKGSYGLCYITPGTSLRKPRDFEIELDSSLSANTIVRNLCHEMVHIKQMARNELGQCGPSRTNNKMVWCSKVVDEDTVDYWDLPWEIEAHGRETGLYLKLMDHYDAVRM